MNIPVMLLAASEKIDPGVIGIKDPVTDADAAISGALSVVYMGAGIVCVLVLIMAGYFYVTSTGDASNIKRAKEAILGAIIGLLVIMAAFTITQFILGRF